MIAIIAGSQKLPALWAEKAGLDMSGGQILCLGLTICVAVTIIAGAWAEAFQEKWRNRK